jgi:hypothetical protein
MNGRRETANSVDGTDSVPYDGDREKRPWLISYISHAIQRMRHVADRFEVTLIRLPFSNLTSLQFSQASNPQVHDAESSISRYCFGSYYSLFKCLGRSSHRRQKQPSRLALMFKLYTLQVCGMLFRDESPDNLVDLSHPSQQPEYDRRDLYSLLQRYGKRATIHRHS